MRPSIPFALSIVALAAAPALADVTVHREAFSLPVEGRSRLSLDVPVGEVHVVGDPAATSISVAFELRCERDTSRCRRRADAMRLERRGEGDEVRLVVERPRGGNDGDPEVDVEVTLPARFALELDLGVGEAEVAGVTGDVRLDLGVGEAQVSIPAASVRSVRVDVGVGEARLRGAEPERERGFVGSELSWGAGGGAARISVDVGVGEGTVALEP